MASRLYWIDHAGPVRLATMARPRGGDRLADEVGHWQREGVRRVVSLLAPEEVGDLDLAAEPALCRARDIDFESFPIADMGVPADVAAFRQLVNRIAASDAAVAIHCRAGIGRSSLLAAGVLGCWGYGPDAALTAIAKARGLAVPDTDEQRAWILDFARSS